VLLCLGLFSYLILGSQEARCQTIPRASSTEDTTRKSILKLQEDTGIPWESTNNSPLYLYDPSNIKSTEVYDPDKNEYVIYQKIGSFDYRTPVFMSPEDYRKYEYEKSMREYWDSRISGKQSGFKSSLIPNIDVGGEAFDKIFGTNTINIVPQGSAELIFGISISHTDNPTLSEKLRTIPTFDFKEKIQMNVTGSIGDKVKLGINYNTDAMFEFENKTKLQYAGKEDEILKKVEAGDVTLPLTGTLITGSYSLFGLKTEMQFGKLTITSVISQQKGQSSTIQTKGGVQQTSYTIKADSYEANRHFFLAQYFRDIFDKSLENLPVISSGVNIQRIEVWITNTTGSYQNGNNRNIAAFMDLGENKDHIYNKVAAFQAEPGTKPYPANEANQLYQQLTSTYSAIRSVDQVTNAFNPIASSFQIGRDYEKIENARKLDPREYTLNTQLGYISLNSSLNNDEVLAVAFEYTLNGRVYQVGEFSTDGIASPQTLVLKLIKGTTLTPKLPTWNLMMKNIYSLGSGKVESSNFVLNVLYQDDKTGNLINYLPEPSLQNKILLQVMGLDNLNSQNDRQPDGYFDFVDGVTIIADKGKVVFPEVEPFGNHLAKAINDPVLASKYVFQELYDSTQNVAQQMAEKDKFTLAGEYSSQYSSEIRLNATNIPQGSVKVTAGGVPLTENTDYTVDYNLGTVTIINSALIESQTPIQVSLENNQNYGFQTKTLVGTHLDYKFSNNFDVGATILHLTERPYTQKVNYGEEPISNTIWGLNTSYKTQSQLLTKIIDKLPFLNTKTPSTISFFGEFADLIPGHSNAITSAGNAYIDDFESAEIPLDMKSFDAWSISSVPQGQDQLFPEAELNDNLASGFNRAKIAWYVIDPLFLENGSTTPTYIRDHPDMQSSHFVREIYENEIWPNKESETGIPTTISVLNVAFYPSERGPYNYDTYPGNYSKGLAVDGTLNNPESRWGGMMREVLTTDFEAANIQYIEFWLMDPFVENPTGPGGDMFFDLGDISEDILRDSRKSFENGLPTSATVVNVDTTVWGRVPTIQSVVNAFDNSSESRKYQDVGLDGLGDWDEQTFFKDYLQKASLIVSPDVYQKIFKDPSGDDFHYYRGTDYDQENLGILDRYKNYNGEEGNSATAEMSKESYPTTGTTLPDMEDINRDNTLNETESYFQYKISMRPQDLVVGKNNIVDQVEYTATFANGTKSTVKWFQFKIPITDYQNTIGSISDFKSIRFMRLFLRNFTQEVHLRFAELNLVRAEWRKYDFSLMEGSERTTVPEPTDGALEISSVSIEDDSGKQPVNYVLPPGFNRITDPTNPQLRLLNEQSMVLRVKDLTDGDARAAFKGAEMDIRQYKRLRMETHAEAIPGYPLKDGDLTAFIRIGSDYQNNFYEYELPLKVTAPGSYDNNSDAARTLVWPTENSFDILLSDLEDAKKERDRQMALPGATLSLTDLFIYAASGHRISVIGNPSLSNIKVIMIGVRNPSRTRAPSTDDGSPKWGEVWVDELRLNDFIEKGGWAANGHLQAHLADLGSIDLVGQASTPGWGSLDSKINDRSLDGTTKYDLSSNIEMGKFFPEKMMVRLPLYVGYSEAWTTPEYNPLDPDILLSDALSVARTKAEKDSLKSLTEEYSLRKTITLNNVGIGKKGKKSHMWDIANLSANYSFNELYSHNTTTVIDLEKDYKGGLNYDYQGQPANIMPFKNIQFLNGKIFRIIKDFNFYLLPKSISIRNELSRDYNEIRTRDIDNPDMIINPTYRKDFEWTRIYDVKYDVTRQLKIDFTATNLARIDEPDGPVDKKEYPDEYRIWRDSVLKELKRFGRTTSYTHIINATYTIPVNKLPLLGWINSNARYTAEYDWLAGPVYPDSLGINVGNTIKNSNELTLTTMGNLAALYSKSKFLKRVESDTRPESNHHLKNEFRTVTYTKDNVSFKPKTPRAIVHNLKTRDVKVKVLRKGGGEVKGKVEVVNENKINFTSSEQVDGAKVIIEGKVQLKQNPLIITGEYLIRGLMGVRSVSMTITSSQGLYLPGYMPKTTILGMSNVNGALAPGWPFILGLGSRTFFDRAVSHGWLSKDTLLNTPASYTKKLEFSLRSMIEPIPGLKIDLNAIRRFVQNTNSYYIANSSGQFPDSTRNTTIGGSFEMSIISWGTAFEKVSKNNNYASPTFEAFKRDLVVISQRLATQRANIDPSYNPNIDPVTGSAITGDFKNGYGETSSEVMVPAFLAAYTKTNPRDVTLATFPSALSMMPNWRITFDGLSKYDFVQTLFRSITISHQYISTYQIGSYTTNLNYVAGENGLNYIRDLQENFIPQFALNTVTINEQFSPLINVDMNWKNSMTTRIEWKKSRTVTLNLSSNEIADDRINELVVGVGYRFSDVKVILKTGGTQKAFKSNLNLRLDFSIRDNKTIARELIEDVDQPVVGQQVLTTGFTADYALSDRFNLQMFIDQTTNNPFVATTFPTSNTDFGFSLKFTLAQ
jgi:cell surface protein SprA